MRRSSNGYVQVIVSVGIVLILAAAVFLFVHKGQGTPTATTTTNTNLSSACVGKTFSIGSSGNCVRDIDTLTDYMEHSGLTECSFTGGATLTVNDAYDTATAAQVLSVQKWSSCYATQEGFKSNVPQTGSVDKSTWGELCTYGYTDPLHSSASGASASIAAGKAAGCNKLQS